MGTKHSSLPSEPALPRVPAWSNRLSPGAVAVHDLSPLVRTPATKLSAEYVDGVAFLVYDQATGELLFTLDECCDFPEFNLGDSKMLMDSKGEWIAIVETNYALSNCYLIKGPQASQYQLYEIVLRSGYQNPSMQLRFTDASSDEKVLVEAENNYEGASRSSGSRAAKSRPERRRSASSGANCWVRSL